MTDDEIIEKIEKMFSTEVTYLPSNIKVTLSDEDREVVLTLLDKYLNLKIVNRKLEEKLEKYRKNRIEIVKGKDDGRRKIDEY